MAHSSSTSDLFYRYKIPPLRLKFEGNRTVLLNMTEISKSLNRDPNLIIRYFSHKLCTSARFDPKRDCYVINGLHLVSSLQTILLSFSKIFIECKDCGNPETILSSKKNMFLKMICKACGQSNLINSDEKLTKIILQMIKKSFNN